MPAQSIQRVIIYSLNSGNILDVPGHRLGATEMPEVEEERVQTAAGTSRARQRTHRLSVQLRGEEEIQLARIMEEGCPVRALALGEPGTRQIVFNAPARLQRTAAAAGPLGDGVQDIILETTLFDADVSASTNLLAGVPFAGASSESAPLIAELESTSVGVTAPIDLTTRDDGTTLAVTGTDEVLDHDTGGLVFKDSANLNNARGIAFDHTSSTTYVLDSDTDLTINKYDSSNFFISKIQLSYSADQFSNAKSLAYEETKDNFFSGLQDSSINFEIFEIDGNTGNTTQNFQISGQPLLAGLTTHQIFSERRLLVATRDVGSPAEAQISEFEASGSETTTPELTRVIDSPDVVFGLDSFYKRLELVDDIAAITWTGELLRVQDTNQTSAQLYSLHGLSLRGEAPQQRSFRVEANTAIPIRPQARELLRLRMPFPAGGARLQYKNRGQDFEIRALGYDGSVLATGIENLTLPEDTWIVELDPGDIFSDIEVVVKDPGRALGARLGGVAQACDQRIPEPEWAK